MCKCGVGLQSGVGKWDWSGCVIWLYYRGQVSVGHLCYLPCAWAGGLAQAAWFTPYVLIIVCMAGWPVCPLSLRKGQ